MSQKKTAKAGANRKAKPPNEKKLSAIDAAAQVLASAKEPMNAKELIEAMSAKCLWTSPGGKTPHATLYSAIIRENSLKGKDARFVKAERGKFAAK
jgi:HB1/ASXL restriction endonuclease-like protein with HTH domain